jgi:hypothetical protein
LLEKWQLDEKMKIRYKKEEKEREEREEKESS